MQERKLTAPLAGPVRLEIDGGRLDVVVIIDPDAVVAEGILTGPRDVVRDTTATMRRAGRWRITVPEPRRRPFRRQPFRCSRIQVGKPGDPIRTGILAPGIPWLTVTVPAGSAVDAIVGPPRRPQPEDPEPPTE